MKRLFIAIDLPDRIKDAVAETYQAIHGARWVSEEQLHLTLRFIGDTSKERENSLVLKLQDITFQPFRLILKGTGQFPPRRDPTILWIGIEPSPELLRLQSAAERACTSAGCEPEGRKFTPHLTVARLNGVSPERVAHFLVTNSLFATYPFEVTCIQLYESRLGRNGAAYSKLATFSCNEADV